MFSFKIRELSQKRQLISNSTREAQSQTHHIEELLELRLPLELLFTALLCLLMLFLTISGVRTAF